MLAANCQSGVQYIRVGGNATAQQMRIHQGCAKTQINGLHEIVPHKEVPQGKLISCGVWNILGKWNIQT